MPTKAEKYAWVSGRAFTGYILNVSDDPKVKEFKHLNGQWMQNFLAAQHLANAIRQFAKEQEMITKAKKKK